LIDNRPERPTDLDAIDHVNRLAFEGDFEAALVRRLRADGLVLESLVADDGGTVVGHLLLSRLPTTVDGRAVAVAALAPMAVLPERQRQGIGSRLIAESILSARRLGLQAIVVLGHPNFYPRFGFSPAAARHLATRFAGDAFMALALEPGALDGATGAVTYPPAFGLDAA